jgi:NADP-reducing hydrogenase subunit HndC
VVEALSAALATHHGEAVVRATGCQGPCGQGPVIRVKDASYCRVSAADASEIVAALASGGVVDRLLYRDPSTGLVCRHESDLPFFSSQLRRTLRFVGAVDPHDIGDVAERGGYAGLHAVLTGLSPRQVIRELRRSGMTGRGGYPTGLKWQRVAEADGDARYVVCNGLEGDPGICLDRAIVEGDPHSVLEGAAIAAYAVGARLVVLCVSAREHRAVEGLEGALRHAARRQLVGSNMLGTGVDVQVVVHPVPDNFVSSGSALLRAIEGRRAVSRPTPPEPVEKGLWRSPTLIHSAETLAAVPLVFAEGRDGLGRSRHGGTKVIAIGGCVRNSGLVEVPLGTTLREIVYRVGGGPRSGRGIKAVHLGGPIGTCVSAAHLDTPLELPVLPEQAVARVSGGLVVVDENTCMVNLARRLMEQCVTLSCGTCTPCRVGTRAMAEILRGLCEGHGSRDDLDRLTAIGEHLRRTALCKLGVLAPMPTLSTLRLFRDEYEAHSRVHTCSDCARKTWAIGSEP